LSYCPNCV